MSKQMVGGSKNVTYNFVRCFDGGGGGGGGSKNVIQEPKIVSYIL